MSQVIATYVVKRITETLDGRTCCLQLKGAEYSWSNDITFAVPVEQPLSPGDEVTVSLSWPE